jgi:hypothetical protein
MVGLEHATVPFRGGGHFIAEDALDNRESIREVVPAADRALVGQDFEQPLEDGRTASGIAEVDVERMVNHGGGQSQRRARDQRLRPRGAEHPGLIPDILASGYGRLLYCGAEREDKNPACRLQ